MEPWLLGLHPQPSLPRGLQTPIRPLHLRPQALSLPPFFPLPLPLLLLLPFPFPLEGKDFLPGSAPVLLVFLDRRLSGCFSQQSEATWPLFPQCLQRFGLGHSDCI